MANKFTYMPPVNFRFTVLLLNDISSSKDSAMGYLFDKDDEARLKDKRFKETSFKTVSGLESSVDTEQAKVGGQNNYTFYLPGKVKYQNLVLTRGIATQDSFFTKWYWLSLQQDGKFIKKNLLITLNSPENKPMIIWLVLEAYPISWKVTDFDATGNDIVIEELKLAYKNFELIKI